MRQATSQLVYQNGHEPTAEELAKAMDMTVERVREIQRMAQEPASLESPVGEEEDSSLGDFVADENAEAPGKAADRAMVAQQINLALKSLTPGRSGSSGCASGWTTAAPAPWKRWAGTLASPASVSARSRPRPSASCTAASA